MKVSKADHAQAKARLLELLNPGDTVYTVLRKVSKSGMTRQISLYTVRDNTPHWLTYSASKVLGWPMRGDNLVVSGCGMDMGFHTVYTLSQYLFDGGYKLKQSWL